jgi:monoamine oxidase
MSEQILSVGTVIVGAGMSGISAAIHLLDNNYTDFLIFEASDRIGGRINNIKTGKLKAIEF